MNILDSNGYVAPVSLSVQYLNFTDTNNWGVPIGLQWGAPAVPHTIVYDPTVDTTGLGPHHSHRPRRRRLMSEAATEFAALNRDLLLELAR